MKGNSLKVGVALLTLATAMLAVVFLPGFFFCGNTSLPAVTDTFPPAAPVAVSAETDRCQSVKLTWNKSYDVHSVLKTYKIYKDGALLAETHGTPEQLRVMTREFRATGLSNGTAYAFGVSAVDIYGNESTATAFPSVTTLAAGDAVCTDTARPTAPSGFSVAPVAGACRSVAMTLTGQSADGQTGVDHYEIYRDGMKVATTSNGNYAAERFGLVPGKTYDYWETAVDKAGNESAPGNVVHYTTPDCAAVVAGGNLKTLILAVNLPGRPAPSVTMSNIETLAFGFDIVASPRVISGFTPPPTPFNAPNMKGFYKEETYGRVNLVKAGVLGWIQLPGNVNAYCTQFTPQGIGFNCNLGKVKTDALALAASHFGLNPNAHVDKYVIVVNGQAENKTGGDTVFLSDFDLGTAIHEMGHTFGIEHAASWTGRKFGTPVGAQMALPLDFADLPFGSFDLSEYGDPRNRMGGPVINHFAAFQKELMGTLAPAQVGHANVDGNYTLDQVEFPSPGVKELRIGLPGGAGTGKAPFVTAEYRTGRGYDADGQAFRGVQLRLVPNRFFGAGSDTIYVGELTPQAPVFIDWHRRMKYTLVSSDDNQAVLNVCGLGWGLRYELKALFN